MRAVRDANNIISALLSRSGSPAVVRRAYDYLLTLAASECALLVSGDEHLLSLQGALPVHSPASFPSLLDGQKP